MTHCLHHFLQVQGAWAILTKTVMPGNGFTQPQILHPSCTPAPSTTIDLPSHPSPLSSVPFSFMSYITARIASLRESAGFQSLKAERQEPPALNTASTKRRADTGAPNALPSNDQACYWWPTRYIFLLLFSSVICTAESACASLRECRFCHVPAAFDDTCPLLLCQLQESVRSSENIPESAA